MASLGLTSIHNEETSEADEGREVKRGDTFSSKYVRGVKSLDLDLYRNGSIYDNGILI